MADPRELDPRELVVTVSLRLPLDKVIESYADAITPDGGYTGTLNAWIEEYAEGIADDMQRAETVAIAERSWRLAEAAPATVQT